MQIVKEIKLKGHAGFTILEMAVVLVIIGLLLGGMLIPLSTQVESTRIKETRQELDDVTDALIGFAIANQRLPCPDIDGDGLEDNVPAPCNREGDVPWVTLGVGREDAWNNTIRYRVDEAFSAAAPIPDPADTASRLGVQDRAGSQMTVAQPDGPVAVIFSRGDDGVANGWNVTPGTPITCAADWQQNCTYIQDVLDQNFDDILIWLSKNTLLNRMVAAGKWP